jgi:uncharacterized protein YbjT (DUF2867 family)
MNDILIIGPTGNVGRPLLKLLHAAGRKPRALVRDPEKERQVAPLAVPVTGDLLKPETLAAPFAGVERVFVLAPPTPEAEVMERNAFDAAEAAGVKRLVYLSNYGAEEGDDDPHYDLHGRNGKRAASMGIEWTVLRPTRYMPYTPFVWTSVLKNGLLIEGDSDGAITTIAPEDIAAVAFKALTEEGHAGKFYDLTSNDALTAHSLADILAKAAGRDVRLFDGNIDQLRTALLENGAPPEYAPLMAAAFARTAEGHFKRTDTVEKLLGRPPVAYADWLRENLPAIRALVGA